MFLNSEIFHLLPDADRLKLPARFNDPFHYLPSDIVKFAADELKEYLKVQNDFEYAFGHDENSVGKMFGILVVKNNSGQTGYLAAFSGKINESNTLPGFVTPVFDVLEPTGEFKTGEQKLNEINRKIFETENSEEYLILKNQLEEILREKNSDLKNLKLKFKQDKAERNRKRAEFEGINENLLQELENESKRQHFELKDRKKYWDKKNEEVQANISEWENALNGLKQERKERSADLQNILHKSFRFLNGRKEQSSLLSIFEKREKYPPAGAGECAAPRLLQYAYQKGYKPVAMGEFWYGKSPSGEVREHGNFYAACKSKCEPILDFMLQGLYVNENGWQEEDFKLDIIFEDEWLLIINKPENVLSVPGKKIRNSIQTKVQEYLQKESALPVHRLDMATSGIMLIAKSMEIYRNLQQQFTDRTVKKTYTAVLEGEIQSESGKIELPIRVDLDNRPQQMVCKDHGKSAVTYYKVLEKKEGKTRINFYPFTGRTHQLRIHAAHFKGLHAPIVGDDLYGKPSSRLMLHASGLEFEHPVSGERMKIKSPATF